MSFSRRMITTVVLTLIVSSMSTVFCAPEAGGALAVDEIPDDTNSIEPVVMGPVGSGLPATATAKVDPKRIQASAQMFISYFQNKRSKWSKVVPSVVEPTSVIVAVRSSSSTVESVISFAMAQLGKPYVWGATGPNTYDCSGLVQSAFGSAGIKTTRTTRTLINEGSQVGRDQLVRGDLVFTRRGHVGIYVGDDQIIHAPKAGDVVKISKIWAFYTGRRIV